MAEQTLFEHAHAVKRSGAEIHNWKGGRSIASNGYVLIRVGIDHHLADVRGYAYEHRIEAEKKIGRRLAPGEIVHHVNGDKKDNRHENLEVCLGNAGHFVHHRRCGSLLRMPGEPNVSVQCACGCGLAFLKYDDSGRPRRFISGHNDQPAPTMLAVLACLASGPRLTRDIVAELNNGPFAVKVCLHKLKRRGLIISKGRGLWELPQ